MDVRIVTFPDTKVAALEHRGPPALEHQTVRRLIAWRREHGLTPDRHRSYGVHYHDPRTTPAADYRVDFCVSIEDDVAENAQGIVTKVIPGGRCALARHLGSREHNTTAEYLHDVWLPASGERRRDFPIFFHYVNVGPAIAPADMITDVYLPLR